MEQVPKAPYLDVNFSPLHLDVNVGPLHRDVNIGKAPNLAVNFSPHHREEQRRTSSPTCTAVLHRRPASPSCIDVLHRRPAVPTCIATSIASSLATSYKKIQVLYEDGTIHTHAYVQDNRESVRGYGKERRRCYECPDQNRCNIAFPLIGGHFVDTTDYPCEAAKLEGQEHNQVSQHYHLWYLAGTDAEAELHRDEAFDTHTEERESYAKDANYPTDDPVCQVSQLYHAWYLAGADGGAERIAVLQRRPASPPCTAVQHRQSASPTCNVTELYKDGTTHRCSTGAPPISGHFSDTTDDPCYASSYRTRGKGPG